MLGGNICNVQSRENAKLLGDGPSLHRTARKLERQVCLVPSSDMEVSHDRCICLSVRAVVRWGSELAPYSPMAARFRCLGWRLAMLLVVGMHVPSIAASHERKLSFDIPAQPLEKALEAYGNLTGRDALYKSDLIVGRRSTGVRGIFPPESALLTLLQGTGLVVRHSTRESFILLPGPSAQIGSHPPKVSEFYGRLQVSLRTALCADDDARPGNYRVALRLWIGAGGDVVRFERLGTAGTKRIDDSVDRSLRRLSISSPPPNSLAQPVTVVVVPQARGVTMGCDSVVHRDAKAGR